MSGRHIESGTSRLKRKILGVPVAVWAMVVLGAGVALAVILQTLGITGTFTHTVAPQAQVEYTAVSFSPGGSSPGTDCTFTHTANSITVTSWSTFGPNQVCAANVMVRKVSGNTAVYLADFVEDDPNLTITMGADSLACHGEVTATASGFQLRITASNFPTTTPGTTTATLDPGDGIQFSDSPTEGDCTSAT